MTLYEKVVHLHGTYAHLATNPDPADIVSLKDSIGKLLDEIEAMNEPADSPLANTYATLSVALIDATNNPASALSDLARAASSLQPTRPMPNQTKPALQSPSKPQGTPEPTPAAIPTYLTTKELQEHLKLSRKTLYRMRLKGLPFVRVGREVRYDPGAVLRWIATQPSNTAGGGPLG